MVEDMQSKILQFNSKIQVNVQKLSCFKFYEHLDKSENSEYG